MENKSQTEGLTKAEKLTVMLACLFHDLGKAPTTEVIDGRVKAHGHAEVGRGGEVDFDCVTWFNERVAGLDLMDNTIKPILMGRHLIEMGMKPSKRFGEILDAVFEMQLDGTVTNLDEAKRAVSLL